MWIMTSRIAVIAIDAQQPRVVADFWCAVLGWEVIEVDEDGVSIAPPDRAWPAIDVFAVPERKGAATPAQPRRSARRHRPRPEVSWIVLADPEGNEFCLLARSVQQL